MLFDVVYAGYQISAWQTNMTRAWLGCWYHNLYFFENIFNIGQRLKHESSHIAAMFYTERHWSAWIWLGKPILVNLLWIQLLWNQCIDSKVNQQHETWFLAPGVKLTQKLLPPESNYFRYWQFIWEQPSWERIQMKLWNMRNEVKDNWYLPRRKTH